ncbi:MAG: polynucleotide adenylyltransferase PcnB, partial [Proteobacteria bacterium]|nr:polynucleotide adenylyltransferase PcnB [Pseudomonadota bacterium]
LVTHKRFRAAYDFLLLREESGEKLDELGQWWTDFQEADEDARRKLKLQTTDKKKRKRNRKRRSNHDRMSANSYPP